MSCISDPPFFHDDQFHCNCYLEDFLAENGERWIIAWINAFLNLRKKHTQNY